MTYFSDMMEYNQYGDKMIIYIDVLIIINTYITYFTLKATARLLHAGYNPKRLILASVLGGISSVTAALPLGFVLLTILRLFLTAGITYTAFGRSCLKQLLLRSVVNITGAMLISGAAILLREVTGNSIFCSANGYAYLDISVMTLIISTAAVYGIITLFRRISDKQVNTGLLTVMIKNGNKTASLKAYPDSGNNLRDFLTGKPVIVCRREKLKEIIPEGYDNPEDIPKGVRLIPFSSVGGSGIIRAFRAENVVIKKENGEEKAVDVLIGTGSINEEDFDAILNPKILI